VKYKTKSTLTQVAAHSATPTLFEAADKVNNRQGSNKKVEREKSTKKHGSEAWPKASQLAS